MPNRVNQAIQAHYGRPDVGSVILAALEKAGKDLDRLTPEDLAPCLLYTSDAADE